MAALSLGACEAPPTACGEVPPGGGPRAIVTREHELCEIVRLRVEHELTRLADLDEVLVQRWHDASWGWADARTPEGVVTRVRQDCGDGMADAVARAVEDVRAHSTRAVGADCEDAERCLARGAGLGARFAIENALYYLRYEKPRPPSAPNAGD